jgi:hypothetical protein
MNDFCNAEERRADLQAGALCGKSVDFKMDLVCFDCQIDDPTLDGESVGFANRQCI